MEPQSKCRLLAGELQKILSSGITLSSKVIHYIDSTFSNPTTVELEAILQDNSNCEKDPLMELLLYPDESIQLQLEALLERLQFSAAEEQFVPRYLFREPMPVKIRFPDDRESLSLIVTEDIACQFITRLNISKHLHPDLLDALNGYGDEHISKRIKVKLRNSRFTPTEEKIEFLCLFFEKLDAHDNDIFECLGFAFGFLDELEACKDICQALIAKKKNYFISLQKAKQWQSLLQKHNIETLMAQGRRVVLIDQEDARKKMRIIDRISRAIYGKTEYFEPLHCGEERIELGSDRKVEDIIRILS